MVKKLVTIVLAMLLFFGMANPVVAATTETAGVGVSSPSFTFPVKLVLAKYPGYNRCMTYQFGLVENAPVIRNGITILLVNGLVPAVQVMIPQPVWPAHMWQLWLPIPCVR